MAKVYLPGGLIEGVDDTAPISIDAPRVHELIEALAARYPELAAILPYVAVAIDGEIHHDADYVALNAESEVHLVPRIAGG